MDITISATGLYPTHPTRTRFGCHLTMTVRLKTLTRHVWLVSSKLIPPGRSMLVASTPGIPTWTRSCFTFRVTDLSLWCVGHSRFSLIQHDPTQNVSHPLRPCWIATKHTLSTQVPVSCSCHVATELCCRVLGSPSVVLSVSVSKCSLLLPGVFVLPFAGNSQ